MQEVQFVLDSWDLYLQNSQLTFNPYSSSTLCCNSKLSMRVSMPVSFSETLSRLCFMVVNSSVESFGTQESDLKQGTDKTSMKLLYNFIPGSMTSNMSPWKQLSWFPVKVFLFNAIKCDKLTA